MWHTYWQLLVQDSEAACKYVAIKLHILIMIRSCKLLYDIFFLNELHVMIKTYALHEMEVLLRTCVAWRSGVSKAATATVQYTEECPAAC